MDHLTERARLAVLLAEQEARTSHAAEITTAHLLAGLLREDEGLAAELLTNHGVRVEAIREMGGSNPPEADGDGAGPALSDTARFTLDRALQEARWLELDHVATEHLLLALLHEGDPGVIRLLIDAGLSERAIRDELVRRARRRR